MEKSLRLRKWYELVPDQNYVVNDGYDHFSAWSENSSLRQQGPHDPFMSRRSVVSESFRAFGSITSNTGDRLPELPTVAGVIVYMPNIRRHHEL